MSRQIEQQGTPNRLPGESETDGIPDDQQEVKEPTPRQTHENKENPRDDHGTNHLGYNRTHLKDNPGPAAEGSDKI